MFWLLPVLLWWISFLLVLLPVFGSHLNDCLFCLCCFHQRLTVSAFVLCCNESFSLVLPLAIWCWAFLFAVLSFLWFWVLVFFPCPKGVVLLCYLCQPNNWLPCSVLAAPHVLHCSQWCHLHKKSSWGWGVCDWFCSDMTKNQSTWQI